MHMSQMLRDHSYCYYTYFMDKETEAQKTEAKQCVPEHWKGSRHMCVNVAVTWITLLPSLGLSLPVTTIRCGSRGSLRALSALEHARRAGPEAALLCARPPHSAGLGGAPSRRSSNAGQVSECTCVWFAGSARISSRPGIRTQITQLPAPLLGARAWQGGVGRTAGRPGTHRLGQLRWGILMSPHPTPVLTP